MTYTRKTRDYWAVEGNYGYGDGWEEVTAEETWKEIKDRLREYRENERGVPFRARKHREKIESAGAGRSKVTVHVPAHMRSKPKR